VNIGKENEKLVFGRPYIRVADEDRQMSAAEYERFVLQKNAARALLMGLLSSFIDREITPMSQYNSPYRFRQITLSK
jgi:hypothetical protein